MLPEEMFNKIEEYIPIYESARLNPNLNIDEAIDERNLPSQILNSDLGEGFRLEVTLEANEIITDIEIYFGDEIYASTDRSLIEDYPILYWSDNSFDLNTTYHHLAIPDEDHVNEYIDGLPSEQFTNYIQDKYINIPGFMINYPNFRTANSEELIEESKILNSDIFLDYYKDRYNTILFPMDMSLFVRSKQVEEYPILAIPSDIILAFYHALYYLAVDRRIWHPSTMYMLDLPKKY